MVSDRHVIHGLEDFPGITTALSAEVSMMDTIVFKFPIDLFLSMNAWMVYPVSKHGATTVRPLYNPRCTRGIT